MAAWIGYYWIFPEIYEVEKMYGNSGMFYEGSYNNIDTVVTKHL